MKIGILLVIFSGVFCKVVTEPSAISNLWESINNEGLTGLLASFSSIIFSEIGDRSFIMIAIMSMKFSRSMIFLGAGLS